MALKIKPTWRGCLWGVESIELALMALRLLTPCCCKCPNLPIWRLVLLRTISGMMGLHQYPKQLQIIFHIYNIWYLIYPSTMPRVTEELLLWGISQKDLSTSWTSVSQTTNSGTMILNWWSLSWSSSSKTLMNSDLISWRLLLVDSWWPSSRTCFESITWVELSYP